MPDLPISICATKLAAATVAHNQASGRDIFTEAERVNGMRSDTRAYYERTMAYLTGLKPKDNRRSAWDVLRYSSKKGQLPTLGDGRYYASISEKVSPKFYNGVDAKLTAWAKTKGADRQSYNEQVAKPVRRLIKAIDTVITESNSKAEINRGLSKFGLTTDTAYDAKSWLNWLADGGHLQGAGNWGPLVNKAGQISKAQANLNLAWTLGNGVDMTRVVAHYAARPGGIGALLKGVFATLKATNGNPFKRVKSLEAKQLYGSQNLGHEGGNNDPFSWSITAQKNFVYHIDKAHGGDGFTGVRDLLFDRKPWDVATYDQHKGTTLVFGLARFAINEARWYHRTVKGALTGNLTDAKTLAVWGVSRALLTGAATVIPAPLWRAFPKEWKDEFAKFDEEHGLNLFKLESPTYLQPGGGTAGARAKSIWDTADRGIKNAGKVAVDVAQGKPSAAVVHTLATASALANFGVFSSAVGKVMPAMVRHAETAENSIANSTTLTKVYETVGDQLREEFDAEKAKNKVVHAVFGGLAPKKAE